MSPELRDAVGQRAASARTHEDAQALKEILLSVSSLGQRLNWGQLAAFVSDIDDPQTLALLAGEVRDAGAQLPVLFAAAELSRKLDRVAAS